jgi:hypothetical protein
MTFWSTSLHGDDSPVKLFGKKSNKQTNRDITRHIKIDNIERGNIKLEILKGNNRDERD